MLSIIVRLVVNAVALWVAAAVISGVEIDASSTSSEVWTVVIVAAIFGVINTVVRPIVKVLTMPAYLLTLGLFTFVVNALMLWLTSWVADLIETGTDLSIPFEVHDFFWAAVLGSLVVSFVSWLLNILLPNGK